MKTADWRRCVRCREPWPGVQLTCTDCRAHEPGERETVPGGYNGKGQKPKPPKRNYDSYGTEPMVSWVLPWLPKPNEANLPGPYMAPSNEEATA